MDFPNWPDVVEPILNDWVTFVILILIFVIGCRKRDGLWSLGHQWNNPQQPAVWAPQGPQTAWVPQGPQAAWLPPQGQQPAYGAPGAIPPEGYANAGYTQQPYAPKP